MYFPDLVPLVYEQPIHQPNQRLLQELSMVLCGKPHNPPGSVAPWLLPGGDSDSDDELPAGTPQRIIGVGGPGVPTVFRSSGDIVDGQELQLWQGGGGGGGLLNVSFTFFPLLVLDW